MTRSLLLACYCVFCSSILWSQVPMGSRILGLQLSNAENGNFDSSFAYSENLCIKATNLLLTWKDIETSPHVYGNTYLYAANAYYGATKTQLSLNIAPIDFTYKLVPSDLMNTRFDDTSMIHRFEKVLDYVFAQIPDVSLLCLNFGNELDNYLLADTALGNQYIRFFKAVSLYAKSKRPGLKIGTTSTFNGLVNNASYYNMYLLNQASDIISLTYYGVKEDFTVKHPDSVLSDFTKIVDAYKGTGKPIYFQECGYPSSSVCLSSETLQKTFVQKVFAAWDTHKQAISFISLFKLTDWDQPSVDYYATYYGISDLIFKEYLRTLGFRTYSSNGKNKLAYDQIHAEMQARGACLLTAIPLETNSVTSEFVLYPNPVNDILHVSHSETGNDPWEIRFCDFKGNTVYYLNGYFSFTDQPISLSFLPKGVYTCEWKQKGQKKIKKIVVE